VDDPHKEFVYQLTEWQGRLYGYLMTLLGDPNDARDVLQETNLVLWRKIDEFEEIVDFGAWARKCAYYQTLAFLRDRKRDRHIFDDDLLARFAEEVNERHAAEEELALALRDCLSKLQKRQRQLISRFYQDRAPVRKLAADLGKSESAIKMALMRTREILRTCININLRGTTI
jgi:RNA polymerase sigma-70 factor (ECF subfamily)